MESIPPRTWSRRFDAKEPDKHVHTFTRPAILEALSLLPIAYRVTTYINSERGRGSEPIFDFNGLMLEPPKPGPHAGAPLGGMGGGCICRGFKGEFRRWTLQPGRYVHRVICADVFCLRVKRNGVIYSKVLSVIPPEVRGSSPLNHWDWTLSPACGTYHALYPRSWTVYENPVPGVTVVIEQVSPFIPESYSEASLPCATFQVRVTNTDTTSGAEVSVMFCFQNGYEGGSGCVACSSAGGTGSFCSCTPASQVHEDNGGYSGYSDSLGGLTHTSFSLSRPVHAGGPADVPAAATVAAPHIVGVCMARPSAVASSLAQQNPGDPCPDCGRISGQHTAAVAVAAGAAVEGTLPTDTQSTSSTPFAPDSPGAGGARASASKTGQPEMCPRCSSSGLGSYTIAAQLPQDADASANAGSPERAPKITTCAQFITDTVPLPFNLSTIFCGGLGASRNRANNTGTSAKQLWDTFHATGDISDCDDCKTGVSVPGTRVGAAVCLKQWLEPRREVNDGNEGHSKLFSFSLAWDDPLVQFGNRHMAATSPVYPRYYTRFFGTSGLASPRMAAYALLHVDDWRERIHQWQTETLMRTGAIAALQQQLPQADGAPPGTVESESPFYDSMLFNELYFLADGGTLWLDSCAGRSNQKYPATADAEARAGNKAPVYNSMAGPKSAEADDSASKGNDQYRRHNSGGSSNDPLLEPLHAKNGAGGVDAPVSCIAPSQLRSALSSITAASLDHSRAIMLRHDVVARNCCGDQRVVGQFLYLEGHEYLMYNSFDVHFYASFALLMLWPQLELSLQLDIVRGVFVEDPTRRIMMGTGVERPRKVKGIVPHDVGSPTEQPWALMNAYNFQDVTRWKDLGPKLVLQVYRDYYYLSFRSAAGAAAEADASQDSKDPSGTVLSDPVDSDSGGLLLPFLRETYAALRTVMETTQAFDKDGDGMIENEGFPDQTYDIWTATGVHAYCGGLWIAACEAMVKIATLLDDQTTAAHYSAVAAKARLVYMDKLWNGRYLNFDSSESAHHDSIMADMLAGQWYARSCALPPVLPPRLALSCYRAIYQHNVVDFGEGRLIGAVNGMRPPPGYSTTTGAALHPPASAQAATDAAGLGTDPPPLHVPIALPPGGPARVDDCCMQSREVWTGTTYGLAAAMVQEARAAVDETSLLTAAERAELMRMAHRTAQGIHDGGWQEFGYWFATPEGWERSGNYRSLGYMRALGIWAMQYAKESLI